VISRCSPPRLRSRLHRPLRAAATRCAAGVLLCLWPAQRAAAQTCNSSSETASGVCSFNATLSAIIPYMAQLSSSASTTSLGTLDRTTLAAGSLVTSGPTVTAVANFAWSVSIKAGATAWSFTGASADPQKPAADLRWRVGTGAYAALSTAGAQVTSGAAGSSSSVTLTFSTLWPWASSPPGDYSVPVTLTLTAP
jgi:hypothetical protein